ncbi:helix-turn-helix transcriptional regulator [soil metagenome]
MRSRAFPSLPLPVTNALKKMGQDIADARRRRRIPTTLMAERAMISRGTLARVEKGSPQVSLGIYATVLFILGLHKRLADLADVRSDDIGLSLDDDRLPQKIYLPRSKREPKP